MEFCIFHSKRRVSILSLFSHHRRISSTLNSIKPSTEKVSEVVSGLSWSFDPGYSTKQCLPPFYRFMLSFEPID